MEFEGRLSKLDEKFLVMDELEAEVGTGDESVARGYKHIAELYRQLAIDTDEQAARTSAHDNVLRGTNSATINEKS